MCRPADPPRVLQDVRIFRERTQAALVLQSRYRADRVREKVADMVGFRHTRRLAIFDPDVIAARRRTRRLAALERNRSQ